MTASLFVLIVVGFLMTAMKLNDGSQAVSPVPIPIQFEGEYSLGGGEWKELTPGSVIPANGGDLRLKGYFDVNCAMNEVLYMYLDHLDMEISINGEKIRSTFKPTPEIAEDFCGSYWYNMQLSGVTRDDQIEILLHSAHGFGNKHAYRDFLDNLYHAPMYFLQDALLQRGKVQRGVAMATAVFSFIILGFALAFSLIQLPLGGKMALLGLSSLLMSGYTALDTQDVYLWSQKILFNTSISQICMMLAALGFCFFVSQLLKEREKPVALCAVSLLTLFNAVVILLSALRMLRICSALLAWVVVQMCVCAILVVCLIRSYGKAGITKDSFIALVCGLMLALILIDLTGSLLGWKYAGMCSKTGFVVAMLLFCCMMMRVVPGHYREALRVKQLEGELEESRIAVMVSQIHPHFLFNALSTIRHLCRTKPDQAWEALGDFSAYLRANTDALTSTKLIPFSQELRHIQSYLKLEKLRFGDRLNIEYDLEEEDFLIPPLTVQPLVENAVKHGIFYAKDGGTVRIETRRSMGTVFIVIQDDGVGFDADSGVNTNDRVHVGIRNVQTRLGKLLHAQMTIESEKHRGTTVTIRIG